MPTYRNKTIKFNMDDEKERELWEFLEKLPYGTFTLLTKLHWELRMENNKEQ